MPDIANITHTNDAALLRERANLDRDWIINDASLKRTGQPIN